MLIERIRADQIAARKARDPIATGLLTTLIGELSKPGPKGERDTSDAKVVKMIGSFVGNIELTLNGDGKIKPITDSDARSKLEAEREILIGYVPTKLTDAELRAAISELFPGEALTLRDTNRVKTALEERNPGAVDGKLLSMILKDGV